MLARLPRLVLVIGLAACGGRGAEPASLPAHPERSSEQQRGAESKGPRAPITLTYLGVAGWQLDGAGKTLLVDPYFSRPDLDRPFASDPAAVAARSPARADLVMVGHTHVDHVLDAPAVAARTGAELMGSLSTALYARATGLPDDRIIPIKGGEDYAFDGFSVRVVPALHSALDDKHELGSALTAPPILPVGFDDLPEGGTFAYLVRVAGQQVFFLGSANFIEREVDGLRPDVAVIGVGLRQEVHDYTCRLLRALGKPPRVYANHFDDWRSPPPARSGCAGPRSIAQRCGDPETVPLDDDLRAFVAEVEACAPGTEVVVPRHFAPMVVE